MTIADKVTLGVHLNPIYAEFGHNSPSVSGQGAGKIERLQTDQTYT